MNDQSKSISGQPSAALLKATGAEESVRLRVRVIYEYEYDANPGDYGTADPVAMAAIDAEGIGDDPLAMLGNIEPKQITVEPVLDTERRPGQAGATPSTDVSTAGSSDGDQT